MTWVDNRLFRSNPPSPSPSSRKSATKHKQPTSSSSSSLIHSSESIPAVPVAAPRHQTTTKIPRSDSLPSHIHRLPHPTSTFQRFPIRADDMNALTDLNTPRRDHDNNNNNNNPISSRKHRNSPSNTISLPASPSKLPNNRRRTHRRTSSEGTVLHISSDEDLSSSGSGSDGTTNLNPNVQALFGLVNNSTSKKTLPPSTPIRPIPPFKKGCSTTPSSASSSYNSSLQSKCGGVSSNKTAVYFASSMFQNSPSPEELPDPPVF